MSFSATRRTPIKALYFDGSGCALCEAAGPGRFDWPEEIELRRWHQRDTVRGADGWLRADTNWRFRNRVPSIDLESLPGEARSLIERLAERAQEDDRLERENRLLREMLRLERLKKYGPKSEKLSEEQVELLELEPGVHVQEVEKESGVSSGRKKLLKREHAGRNALPDHLPRREEIITVEGEERLCVCCGEERCRIGYEEKEVLDMEPARYFVRVIKREKLACRNARVAE